MNNSLMFSSKNQAWATRWETYYSIQKQLGRIYNLDPCAEDETTKCKEYYITKEEDVFSFKHCPRPSGHDVPVTFFANPEYGRMLPKFVTHLSSWCDEDGIVGDLLIPARTDTKIFHDVIIPKATTIRFVKGRITFGSDEYWEWVWEQPTMIDINGSNAENALFKQYGKMNAAPFPSMIVSFGEDKQQTIETITLTKNIYKGKMV